MSTKRALTVEAFLLLVNNFGTMVVSLVGTILVTRALGPEARGIYAWLMTVSAIATQLATLVSYNSVRQLGITAAASDAEGHWPRLAGTFSAYTLLGWLLTLPLLGWALWQPLGQSHLMLLLLLWLVLPVNSLLASLGCLVHLRRRVIDIVLPTLMPRLAVTLLIILGWSLHVLTLSLAVGLNPLAGLIAFLLVFWWLGLPLRRWQFDAALARQIAGFLGATWLATLLAFAAPKIVLLILPHYVGLAQLGYYSIASTLLDVALMVPSVVTSILVSQFTRHAGSRAVRRQTLLALLVVLAACAVFGYLTAPFLLPKIFGPAFIAAVPPFRILLLALLLQAPQAVYTGHLTATAHARGLLLPPLASLFITTLATFYLVPLYGLQGAALAAVTGYAVQLLCTLPFMFSRRQSQS